MSTQSSDCSLTPAIGTGRPDSFNLTIHRRTATHHGRTLRTLGHAAEYLSMSRAFAIEGSSNFAPQHEAVHLLMRLSHEVFTDYSVVTQQRHAITDWMVNQAVRIYGAS